MTRQYRVYVVSDGSTASTRTFGTITEGRRYAESFGNTADYARIEVEGSAKVWKDREVESTAKVAGVHRRSPEGDGMRWYKALT